MNKWEHHTEGPGAWHVWPVDDLRAHETGAENCWCLPMWEPVATNDGNVTLLVSHNSLDGRERAERWAALSWWGRVRARFDKLRNHGLR